jgi:hypothetical protein
MFSLEQCGVDLSLFDDKFRVNQLFAFKFAEDKKIGIFSIFCTPDRRKCGMTPSQQPPADFSYYGFYQKLHS